MTSASPSQEPAFRRYVLAAGTRHYPEDPELTELPGAEADAEHVAALFESLGYTRILPHLGSAPRSQQLLAELEDWLANPDRSQHDVLVVYFAGHGVKHPQRRDHYLMCVDSRIARPQSTAIRSADLASLVATSSVGYALLILDTCYAGAGTAEMAFDAVSLTALRDAESTGLWLLAAARAREEAVDHAFVPALVEALQHSRAGMRQRHLNFLDITNRIDLHLREHHPHQSASCHATDVRTPPPFFPNPDYRPDLSPALVDVQTAREWAAHFDPRSRGVEYASEKGDYFTGRLQALATLSAWLRDPRHDSRARVITGSPGSGKSALLGRLLALADPDPNSRPGTGEHVMPPPGCITAAVHARGTTLESLTGRLASVLGVDADSPDQLLSGLADTSVPATVLIDALDEAGTGVTGSEPQRIARELLRPLSALGHVRLIIGSRRETVDVLGSAVEVIDLDADGYRGQTDIEDYSRACLLTSQAEGSKYSPETLRTIAAAVASRAQGSFLVARMTVRAIAHGDLIVDIDVPGWRDQLPTEAGQAFDTYLARYGDKEALLRRLLAPLAYAEGEGLPWDSLWAPLAGALSRVPCSDEDIEWLFRHAGAYIVEVPVTRERSVFRLFHEALAEHLRNPRRDAENQRRLTATLLEAVPLLPDGQRDWLRAHPYILDHLSGHSAASGELPTLLNDAHFLVHADPDALLSAMDGLTDPAVARIRAMYRNSAHLHRHAPSDSRAEILAVDALRFGLSRHGDSLRQGLCWAPRWATRSQASSALLGTLDGHGYFYPRLDCTTLAGDPLMIMEGPACSLWLWNLRSRTLHASLRTGQAHLTAIRCGEIAGEQVVVVADHTGQVEVWNLTNRTLSFRFTVPEESTAVGDEDDSLTPDVDEISEEYGEPGGEDEPGEVNHLVAADCAAVDGIPVLVGCGRFGTLSVWNLLTGELIHHARTPKSGWNPDAQLSCTVIDGTPHAIVTPGSSGPALLWNLETLDWSTIGKPAAETGAHAAVTLGGTPAILLGDTTGHLTVHDPATGSESRRVPCHSGWVTALAVAPHSGAEALVIGYGDGTVEVREPADGRLIGKLNGHGDWVHHIAVTQVDGTPLIITSSSDHSIRLWSLPAEQGTTSLPGHASHVQSIACTVVDGVPIAVTGSADQSVRTWDLTSGVQLGQGEAHSNDILSVTCVEPAGVPIAVTSGYDDAIWSWSLPSCAPIRTAADTGRKWTHVTSIMVNGAPVVVTGSQFVNKAPAGGAVVVRDAATLEAGYPTAALADAFSDVSALACTTLDGSEIAVVADYPRGDEGGERSVQVWDLITAQRLGSFDGCADQVNALACTTVGLTPVAVVGTAEEGTQVWDLRTFSLRSTLDKPSGWISDVACTVMDGKPVAVTVGHHTMCIWDLTTSDLLHAQTLPNRLSAVAVGPDGELVLGCGYDVVVLERVGQKPAGSA
ncbi:caspase family protein [Streptomyces sp. NPDC002680]|uniref:caspase family protein n=1 Tax=Streptomyces sp. NPDC002680 TaxID=3364659 RepID=UPI00367BD114